MALIQIIEKWIEYRTDLGVTVRAYRPYLRVEFVDGTGSKLVQLAMLDTGASFGVLPYTYWHDRNIPWHLLGSQLIRAGQPDTAALTWMGASCQLGEARVTLIDKTLGSRSSPLRLVAKFPDSKVPSHMEQEIILGSNFLVDNSLVALAKGSTGRLEGVLIAS